MDDTPVTTGVKFTFLLSYANILWSVLLATCLGQSHASVTMLETDNTCTDEGTLCLLTGKFLFPDTRCWLTCRRDIRGRREKAMVMMEVVGASSYCHVISGPEPGLYKCDRDGQWRAAKAGGEIKPLKRVKKFFWRRRRRRRRSPPPNKPPYFTRCPRNIEVYAPIRKTTAVVRFTVTADDTSGTPSLTQTAGHGYRSGSTFNEGLTRIQYTARDSGGLTATCSTNIKVLVHRCSDLPVLSHFPHGTQTCSGIEKRIYGSSCKHSCHAGYVLRGSQTVTCQSNSAWSTNFPSCQPVSCGDPGVVAGGDVLCAQGHLYPQSCHLQCQSGFQATGATSIKCQDTGQWSSQLSCQDIEAPKFPNGCTADQQIYSGPLESPVPVTWSDPVTSDNSGAHVTLSSNLAKGSLKGIGVHNIHITATDTAGNSDSCSFVITVESRKCTHLLPPANGQVSCTLNNVEGSECTMTCNLGYELKGVATLHCLKTQLWNASEPTCEAIICPSPAVQHGAFQCPRGFQHPATCGLTCSAGFQIIQPSSIECLKNAAWSTFGSCRDVQPPQFSNGCPTDMNVYAAPFGKDTVVSWTPPDVTDNSGNVISIQSDVSPGASFPPGVSKVTYEAFDATGNTETCQFSVKVTVLSCDDPKNGLSQSDSQSTIYTCPNGHVYGARCTVSCVPTYMLVGDDSLVCEQDTSTIPPTMTWQTLTGLPVQSVCRDVQPPQFPNGCPANMDVYAAPFGKDTVVSWIPPHVTDNSGNVIRIQSDVNPGASFPPGVSKVTYKASDATGNTETCQFSVEVTVLSCDDPKSDLSQSDSQSTIFTCPNGHVYGARCTVSCVPTYALVGDDSLVCEQDNSMHPPTMTWQTLTGLAVQSVCRDVQPPQFPNGCPTDMDVYAAPFGKNTVVSWTPPDVTDNSGNVISLQSDVSPGASFPPGVSKVTYEASDATGNTETCQFSVEVTVLSCDDPKNGLSQSDSQSTIYTCPNGHVYGTRCTVSCVPTYALVGDDSLVCEQDTSTIPPTMTWRTLTGLAVQSVCKDVQPPQFPNGCPTDMDVYAAPFGLDTVVSWIPPDVTDNSGNVISLQSDVSPGASFPPGVSKVTYEASDATGNTETCQFSVKVTVLSCDDPKNGFSESDSQFTIYTCPNGHVYGARCTVSCVPTYALVGDDSLVCEQDNSTHPPTMTWQTLTGLAVQFVCRASFCPVLPPPENGALSCHLGDKGMDCLMSCHEGFGVPYDSDGFFYCTNAGGNWVPPMVPSCVRRIMPSLIQSTTRLFYFTGNCSTSPDELRQTFVTRLNKSRYKDACLFSPLCIADNVEVTCGPVTFSRGKREADDVHQQDSSALHTAHRLTKRETSSHYYLVTVVITVPYKEDSFTPEQVYEKITSNHNLLQQQLLADVREGHLDVRDLVAEESGLTTPKLHVLCPPGTMSRPLDPVTCRFSCVGCSKGFYLPVNATQCLQCPIGFYTELDNATSCIPCPPWWSNPTPGSEHSSQCPP